jgi:hypothetical protein
MVDLVIRPESRESPLPPIIIQPRNVKGKKAEGDLEVSRKTEQLQPAAVNRIFNNRLSLR